jgi:type 1 fimbria pilin
MRFILVAMALAWALATAIQVRGGDEKTFQGEIADTQCALNVHSLSQSHKEMIGMTPGVKTNADCARFCVKERGGRFVLQTKGKVYKLDKQELAEPSAGLTVRIVGTLDPKTNTITVRSIEPVSKNASNPEGPK